MIMTAERDMTEEFRAFAKKTVKDSVFRDLFGNRKYALQLYKALHPEDTEATEEDVSSITIDNVLSDQLYNDLGMLVRGTLLILLEAQSTWSVNIIIRILLYLAHTWHRYIEETNQNRYGSKRLQLPQPEFYVIYTGSPKDKPEWIHLSDEFFHGDSRFIEMNVRVLCGSGSGEDIVSQYVHFTTVYTEQVRKYGRTRKAILETIRICRDQDILKEYLSSREKEVIGIMMALFDQERIMEQYMREYGDDREQIGIQKGEQIGIQKGEQIGIQKGEQIGIQKGEKIGIKKGEQQAIQKIIHTMSINLSNEEIAELLQIPVKDVELSMED